MFANLVQWTAAESLWQGQSLVLDPHHLAQWLAGIGIRVPMGFGVSLMPMRSPYQAAFEARSVALATGHSVVAGFGPGPVSFQSALLGRPYARPLQASREYATIVRALVSGEDAMVEGKYFSVAARLLQRPAPQVEVGLGVLRPKMAALAGEVADRAMKTTRDWSHVCDTFHGPGWVAVGDSAAFIDPLFSSGVWLGTSAAWLAARAIGAALEDAEQEQLALERFDTLYRQMFKDILAYVPFFMDPTRLREEYEERALQIQKMVTQNSRVGFISMISGVSAIADVVDFDPMNVGTSRTSCRTGTSRRPPRAARPETDTAEDSARGVCWNA
ncbi:LLM class flavin-dependent oxidoreductase [Streptomyces sp. NPDC047453]|uniref:LLM class flavin-dependent oxidoreductase n=1 Tax=Streptomyces sp. NPDC047453 TaxID=3154812 RepID=UPI0033C9755A